MEPAGDAAADAETLTSVADLLRGVARRQAAAARDAEHWRAKYDAEAAKVAELEARVAAAERAVREAGQAAGVGSSSDDGDAPDSRAIPATAPLPIGDLGRLSGRVMSTDNLAAFSSSPDTQAGLFTNGDGDGTAVESCQFADGDPDVGQAAAAAVAAAGAKKWLRPKPVRRDSGHHESVLGGMVAAKRSPGRLPRFSSDAMTELEVAPGLDGSPRRAGFRLVCRMPDDSDDDYYEGAAARAAVGDAAASQVGASIGAPVPRVGHDDGSLTMRRSASTNSFRKNAYYSIELEWLAKPRTVLVVTKLHGGELVDQQARELIEYLTNERGMTVYLEPEAKEGLEAGGLVAGANTRTWERSKDQVVPFSVTNKLDLAITLGGDGTVLWLTRLLHGSPLPPVLSFNMGSLGFLAGYSPAQLHSTVQSVLRGGFQLALRHRLSCRIVRAHWKGEHSEEEELRHVLNEVVIDRGESPFLTNLECYCGDTLITNVQGDGIIIATPTGSTAYNLAAGGAMVHPGVPCILFTPICPHSLSFRPLVFPEDISLRIVVPAASRGDAWASFDGKDRWRLSQGDAIHVRVSSMPVPTVCFSEVTSDWITSVKENLHWNDRQRQAQLPGRRLSYADNVTAPPPPDAL